LWKIVVDSHDADNLSYIVYVNGVKRNGPATGAYVPSRLFIPKGGTHNRPER
jgi:hypothetical protein